MKINIGDYIRTNEGLIGKIKRIEFDRTYEGLKWYVFDRKRPNMNIIDEIYINKPYITKYSKNIIDLIELGDYIVLFDENLPAEYVYQIIIEDNKYKINNYKSIRIEDIKSIVTKEQFKDVEHKVGGVDEK